MIESACYANNMEMILAAQFLMPYRTDPCIHVGINEAGCQATQQVVTIFQKGFQDIFSYAVGKIGGIGKSSSSAGFAGSGITGSGSWAGTGPEGIAGLKSGSGVVCDCVGMASAL